MSVEIVAGKSTEELDTIIAAAEAEKAKAVRRDRDEFESLVRIVKEKADALGLKAKTFFTEHKDYPPKFKDPNSEATWNGRGPQPVWMRKLLENVPKEQWKEVKDTYLIP